MSKIDPKKQKELNALKAEELKLNKQLSKSLDTGTLAEVVKLQDNLNRSVAKQNKLLGMSNKSAGELLDSYGESVGALKDVGSQLQVLAKGDKDRIKSAQGVNFESRVYNTLSKDAVKNNEKIARHSGATHEYGKGIVSRAVAASKVYDASESAVSAIASIREQQLANEANLGQELLQNVDASESANAARKAALQLQANMQKMTNTEVGLALRRVGYLKASADEQERMAAATNANIGHSEALSATLTAPFESLKGTIESMPGGGLLSKAFGLDQFGAAMGGAVTKSIQVALVDGPAAGIKNFQGLIKSQKLFNLTAMMNPYVLIVAVVIGLVALLASITKEAKNHAKETGLSVAQAKKQVVAAKELQGALKNNLATTQDIVDVQKSLVAEFGRADMVSDKTVGKLADMGATLGYGADNAAAVASTLMTVGGASEEMAANMQVVAFNMAEAAGVAPGKVMKDMAKNGKLLAKSMSGNAKGMMKVAVAAAQMGTDIEGIVKMTDGLLDIESSLTAQMEYQAISGRSINLDKARQLTATGDTLGAAKEMERVMGKMNILDIKSPIEKEKAAKALNMSVSEMLHMANMQEKSKNMTEEQKNLVNKYGDALGDVTNASADEMLSRAAAAQQTEKMGVNMEKLKNMMITSLMPVVDALASVFEAISPLLGFVMMQFKLIAGVLKVAAAIVGAVLKSIIWLGKLIVDIILYPFKQVYKVLKLIYDNGIGPLMKGLKSMYTSIVQPIKDVFTEIFEVIGGIFGASEDTGESMGIMSKIGDGIATVFGFIGDVLGVIGKVIGFIIKAYLFPLKLLFDGIAFVIGGIGKVLKFVGKIIVSALMVPFNAIKGVIDYIYDGIVSMGSVFSSIFTGIIDIIKSPFNMLIAGANAIILSLIHI